jgi:hypothetical protein
MYVLGGLILTPLKTEICVKLKPDMLGGLAMDSQMEHLGQIMFVEPDLIQETRYVCELKV